MFGNGEGAGGSWWIILVYIGLFAVLYFLLIRPNSKKKKKEQEMRNNIAIGVEITTIGGLQAGSSLSKRTRTRLSSRQVPTARR